MTSAGDSLDATEGHARMRVERLSANDRWAVAIVGVGLLTVLAVAFWLDPDPRGHGTHEQLGMPPCLTPLLFGIPCPFCGMTTAFSLMAHGRAVDAFTCHPIGALAFFVCIAFALVCAVAAVSGRWVTGLFSAKARRYGYGAAVVLLLLGWAYKLCTW